MTESEEAEIGEIFGATIGHIVAAGANRVLKEFADLRVVLRNISRQAINVISGDSFFRYSWLCFHLAKSSVRSIPFLNVLLFKENKGYF